VGEGALGAGAPGVETLTLLEAVADGIKVDGSPEGGIVESAELGGMLEGAPVALAAYAAQSAEAAACAEARSEGLQALMRQGPAMGTRAACLAGSHWQAVSSRLQPTWGMELDRQGSAQVGRLERPAAATREAAAAARARENFILSD